MTLYDLFHPQTIPDGLRLVALAIFVHGLATTSSS